MADIKKIQDAYAATGDDFKTEADKAKLPKVAEVAMIHPQNSSIVKIRDNGMIDVFVNGNNGIRIDPETKTINLMGNSIKEQGGDKLAWLDSYSEWNKGDWKLEVDGQVSIHSKGDMMLKSDTHITLDAPQFDINTGG